jgi:aspartate/methionine/tyrosine aminotransferase
VALIPGDSFGSNGAGFLRLSYAASQQELETALERMRAFLASL